MLPPRPFRLLLAPLEFVDEFGVAGGGGGWAAVVEELADCADAAATAAAAAVFINISLSFFLLLKYSVVDVSL